MQKVVITSRTHDDKGWSPVSGLHTVLQCRRLIFKSVFRCTLRRNKARTVVAPEVWEVKVCTGLRQVFLLPLYVMCQSSCRVT